MRGLVSGLVLDGWKSDECVALMRNILRAFSLQRKTERGSTSERTDDKIIGLRKQLRCVEADKKHWMVH